MPTEAAAGLDADPRQARCFRFVEARFDGSEATLVYALDGLELIERIHFPGAPALPAERRQPFERALRMLHLIAGSSYWKAAVPAVIEIDGELPDAAEVALVEAVYRHGLAEFAHVNALQAQVAGFSLPCAGRGQAAARPLGLPRRALLPLGGGKDSLVSADLLLRREEPFASVWIGGSDLIARCAERVGRPTLNIRRQIAPQLIELNRRGAWNGHVPVTAINSAILVLAALLYGFDEIVFSNESSAEAPTLLHEGRAVNHQWSKGPAFERAFAGWVRSHVASDLHYYSLLRPLSELAVTRRFAQLERYFDVFSSCNRNFRLIGERPSSRWCGDCPKCRFVFLALAPFIAKPRLVAIFGHNLLDERSQLAGFQALLEWGADKPFECVGEARESRAALARLAARADWQEDLVVAHFRQHILPALAPADTDLEALLAPGEDDSLPPRLRGCFATLPPAPALPR